MSRSILRKTTSTRLALTVRILIALCTRTFFQPDEYFQSLEPAHHLVFGYGHLTWEWLAAKPIRSILYPLLNVPIYWALKATELADLPLLGDQLVIIGPKILHGTFAAATDIWICELALRVLGTRYVSIAFFLSLTSFFHALSLSRTLSNSLETSLTTIAFAYYPWDASPNLSPHLIFNRPRIRKTLIFSALACMVRPTNAVMWVYLYANLFWALRSHKRFLTAIISEVLTISTVSILSLFILDSFYYRKPTFTPLNFLVTNLSAVSLFYGSNPWHYYLTQAVPILCTTTLPFVLHGMWSTMTKRGSRDVGSLRTMLGTVMWSIGIYSLAGHKEWRFVHPILPLLHIFAAKSLVEISDRGMNMKKKLKKAPRGLSPRATLLSNVLPIRTGYILFLLLPVPAALYAVFLYCSGPVSVLSYVRSLPRKDLYNGSLGILMPCHSLPGHAYIHRKELAEGGMWALGCEPPLQNQDLHTYRDQTDVFFRSPKNYLLTCFPPNVNPSFPPSPFPASIPGLHPVHISGKLHEYPWSHEWPRYLILFGSLLEKEGVRDILHDKGYKEVWKSGRGWEGEGHRKGGVRVWKWSGR